MSQAKPAKYKNSSVLNINGIDAFRYDFANLIESSSQPSLKYLLELIVQLNRDFLLTREQTSRFLNVLTTRVDELVKLGKLSKTRDGFFTAGVVYEYFLEKRNRELRALAEIVTTDNIDSKLDMDSFKNSKIDWEEFSQKFGGTFEGDGQSQQVTENDAKNG